MSAQTKKATELPSSSGLSALLGIYQNVTTIQTPLAIAAKELLPHALSPTMITSLDVAMNSGIYRVKGGTSTEKLPDGATMSYGLVIVFNFGGDIYRMLFSYLGSVAYQFVNGQNGAVKTTMLCSAMQ